MSVAKKLLPFAFLGLSPAASAAPNAPATKSDAQKITAANRILTPTSRPDTLKLDIAAFARDDTIDLANDMSHIDTLIVYYNKRPNKFRASDITKLLEIMRNPTYLYSQLKMPLTHARYVYDNISVNAMERLGITNRMDIIANSVIKTVYEISPTDAALIMLNDDLAPRVTAAHDTLLTRALDVALENPAHLNNAPNNRKLIQLALNYATEHPDVDASIALYMRVFNCATHMIQSFQSTIGTQTDELHAISWLSMEIDMANHKIKTGSKMDKTIAIRIPSQAVVTNCGTTYNRLVLASLYNRAYWGFLVSQSDKPANGFSIPSSDTARGIFMDYMKIIYLQHKGNRISESQRAKLDTLLQTYPETALFRDYFRFAYVDFGNSRDMISNYSATLMTANKKGDIAIPRELIRALDERHTKLAKPRAHMRSYDIDVPDFVPQTKRMTYRGFKQSDMATNVIFDKINGVLAQQINVILSQERTAKQLLKLQKQSQVAELNTPTNESRSK